RVRYSSCVLGVGFGNESVMNLGVVLDIVGGEVGWLLVVEEGEGYEGWELELKWKEVFDYVDEG
ncbi:hypothetical protein, partial [Bacillus pumilus]|uniref:hypothetical protein n=1 Tax=Bacillus pumilus TaxID=1408 RepID=UPI001C92F709